MTKNHNASCRHVLQTNEEKKNLNHDFKEIRREMKQKGIEKFPKKMKRKKNFSKTSML